MGLLNNDIVQVQFRGNCFGQQIILNHNYGILGNWPVLTSVAQDLQSIITAVAAGGVQNIEASYLACLPPQYSLTEIRAQRITPIRSAYQSIALAGVIGTHASPATVANDAACITMRTVNAGRKQVANQHIGPVPDAVSAAGLLVGAYVVILSALGTKLVSAFAPPGSGSVVVPVIVHRGGPGPDTITNFIVGPQSRVQRRRTVGIGS